MTTSNMFEKCDSISEVVGSAIGAGSVCWEQIDKAGIFQSEQASDIATHATTRIRELITGTKIALPDDPADMID